MVGFISIAFVVVKLKLFKIFQSFSASMKWLWLGSFWPLLLQIWSNFAEVFTRDSILADKKSFWITFEKFEFLRELDGPKVCTFCPTLIPAPLPVSPWGFSKKIDKFLERLQTLSYPNMSKTKAIFPLPIPGKLQLPFYVIWHIFAENRAGSQVEGSKSKFNLSYFPPQNSWLTSCNKVLVQDFPIL